MESLYRKYRPQTFEDVVGQTHVVSTLERAVAEGRTSHAYLFCGPRGTGKTTMARILAKALMCQKGEHQLPDGTCEECQLIATGEHPDVYELDAASRTGVDNVREEIIARVDYAPVRGKYKVYIIDEVHMLTPAAFNALLKTLEEPPSHVVFILCTTDPQKILATILSRVQRFDFRSIGADEMQNHLAHICDREGFSHEDEALELIVRHARGGMRDAISTLEQLSVFGGGAISAAAARDLLGEAAGAQISTLSRALARRDMPSVFHEIASLTEAGSDLLQIARDLLAHVRDVYVVHVVGAASGVVRATEEEIIELGKEASEYGGSDRILRVLDILASTVMEMRTSTNQRLSFEVACTRIARPETDLTLESLAERIEALEAGKTTTHESVAAAVAVPVVTPKEEAVPVPVAMPRNEPIPVVSPKIEPAPAPTDVSKPDPVVAPVPESETASASPSEVSSSSIAALNSPSTPRATSKPDGELQRTWKSMIDNLRKTNASCASLLLQARPQKDDGSTLIVSLPAGSSFTQRMLTRADVKEILSNAVTAAFGERVLTFVEARTAPEATAAMDEGASPKSEEDVVATPTMESTSKLEAENPSESEAENPSESEVEIPSESEVEIPSERDVQTPSDSDTLSSEETVDADELSSMFNDVFGVTKMTRVDEDNNPIA